MYPENLSTVLHAVSESSSCGSHQHGFPDTTTAFEQEILSSHKAGEDTGPMSLHEERLHCVPRKIVSLKLE
jgi:hypothetical protein